MTILFADLAGFTSMAESRDPEEVQELLNRCFDALVPCVERYGGTIDKFMGDAMMVLFGVPVAHDNDAERAMRAALDVRAALAAFNQARGLELAIHQGISTGRVLAGSVGGGARHDYSVIGDAVNVASRLEDLSAPNEILIGPETHALAGFLFETEEAGEITLRGRTESINVYRILGETATATVGALSRLRAPLVGREKELQIFAGALDSLAQGRGSVLCILGEAGLGKTRLVAEARKATGQDAFNWLEGQAISMGQNVSYRPIRQMLERDVGWAPDDDRGERLAKLERRADSLVSGEGEHVLDFLAALLGVETAEHRDWLTSFDEAVFRNRLHRSVAAYFRQLTHERPVVLVFEDLHWVDASSAALIEELASLVASAPLLLCLLSRPDFDGSFFHPERIASLAGKRFQEIPLAPLWPAESRKLVAELLGSAEVPPGLQRNVEKRAEGNPFFIQEILHSLISSGGIQENGSGGWRLGSREGFAVPDTLQGMIASRVDRLPDRARTAIRFSSVVGRSFRLSLLARLAGATPRETAESLRYLEDVEMVRAVGREPEPEFSFSHALVQEAVYETIPLRDRRQLHACVAQAIESAPEGLQDDSDLLAYHYSKAERWDQAQHYLFTAGEKASALGAQEASEYYRQALEALLRGWLPLEGEDQRGSLDQFLAGVVLLHYQWRLSQICEPLQDFYTRIAEAFGLDDRRTLAVAEMLGSAYSQKGMFAEAISILESTLETREVIDGPGDPSLARLLGVLAGCLNSVGRNEDAQKLVFRGLEQQRSVANADHETLAALGATVSSCYESEGQFLKAKTFLEEALNTPGMEETYSYPGLLNNLCDSEIHLGLAADAELHGRLGSESGNAYLRTYCQANLGFALRTFGRYEEARQELEHALDVFDGLERHWEFAGVLADLAECRLQLGEVDLAAESARRAINILNEQSSSAFPGACMGIALWALAGVELARDNLPEVERLITEAAAFVSAEFVAGDPLFEAQLLYRRAQLRLKQGRRDEAEADLTQAAALLEGLGGEEHALRKLMLAEWDRLVAKPEPEEGN